MSNDIETRRAPVQGFSAGIPWSVHCKAYDAYVTRYGNTQSAETLAARGGFGVGELDKFCPEWRAEVDELNKLRADRDSLRAKLDGAKDRMETVCHRFETDMQQGYKTKDKEFAVLMLRPLLSELSADAPAEQTQISEGVVDRGWGAFCKHGGLLEDRVRAAITAALKDVGGAP
jgi:hypothetical protein